MKKKHTQIFFVSMAVMALFLATGYFFTNIYSIHCNPIKHIEVQGYQVRAEVVQSQEKRNSGLGGRSGLCATCGMLFVFENKNRYSFWMKDMEFPIDIIWIADEKVVHIEQNVSHIDQQKTYIPSRPASMILELPAGTCERERIEIGSRVIPR